MFTCLCGNREYPVSFQNKLVSSSFKWVPKCILFLAKLKGERRSFWNGEGVTLTIIKVFIILFLLEEIGNKQAIFKRNQRALISIKCPNWRGEKGLFLRGARIGTTLWDYPQEYLCHKKWKSLSFCEISNNPTPPLFFIRPFFK